MISYEHPSLLGPPLVYTTKSDVVLQRPDKLRVITSGDGPPSEFYYDGKTMMAFEPVATHDVRTLSRDLYVPSGDIGIWQGALRDSDHEWHAPLRDVIDRRSRFTIELLYTDNVGDQRTISRFTVTPTGDDGWMASVGRHFYLDGPAPR